MKKIAYLLTLIILLVPLAGCTGDENDDNPIEGSWYAADTAVPLAIYENGTVGVWNNDPDRIQQIDYGNWTIEGDTLTIDFGPDTVRRGDSILVAKFALDGDWLWVTYDNNWDGREDFGRCYPYSREPIPLDEWWDIISELTPDPSFCEVDKDAPLDEATEYRYNNTAE